MLRAGPVYVGSTRSPAGSKMLLSSASTARAVSSQPASTAGSSVGGSTTRLRAWWARNRRYSGTFHRFVVIRTMLIVAPLALSMRSRFARSRARSSTVGHSIVSLDLRVEMRERVLERAEHDVGVGTGRKAALDRLAHREIFVDRVHQDVAIGVP